MDPAQPMEITLVFSLYPQPFYCLRCKCPMFTHHLGQITRAHPSFPELHIPGLVTCPNTACGMQYKFMGFLKNVSGATKTVTLSLHHLDTETLSTFHCYECRSTAFQYPGELMDMMPGKTTGQPLIVAKCPDSRCGIKFLIYEF